MQSKQQFCNLISRTISRAAMAALAMAIVFTLTQSAQAQTFKVIYNFTAGGDGRYPYAGLTMDRAGSLYGTAAYGGGGGGGTAFRLSRRGSGWAFNPLHSFAGGNDGANPYAGVVFGPDGSLYGTTYSGGGGDGGTVFNLKPPAAACKTALCPWTETVLYGLANPGLGDLIFDQAGNLYGTTLGGGLNSYGTAYKLAPSDGGWTGSILHSFTGGINGDGALPDAGLIFDRVGNLYGTTYGGGSGNCFPTGCGTVYQLTPSGSGWTENVLYNFQNGGDGDYPTAGLIFDPSGNLYGSTSNGGSGGGGTVFKLTLSGGSWTYSLVYSFTGSVDDTCGPWGTLVMDGAGNLYGTTYCDGANGAGNIFKLTPEGGGWTYTSLHDFGGSDGIYPYCSVVFDASGNLYGTTPFGGAYGHGVVWEITFP